jgi:hypothetical protein
VFRRPGSDETILAGHETIFRFSRKHPETAIGYQFINDMAGNAAHPGDRQMRSFNFILTVACFLLGPSLAGSPDGGLQGVGTFSYNGSPVMADAPQLTVVAAR